MGIIAIVSDLALCILILFIIATSANYSYFDLDRKEDMDKK